MHNLWQQIIAAFLWNLLIEELIKGEACFAWWNFFFNIHFFFYIHLLIFLLKARSLFRLKVLRSIDVYFFLFDSGIFPLSFLSNKSCNYLPCNSLCGMDQRLFVKAVVFYSWDTVYNSFYFLISIYPPEYVIYDTFQELVAYMYTL